MGNFANLGEIVGQLTDGIKADSFVHLDPDLRYDSLPKRPPGWKPIFGQCGIAQQHLRNQGVRGGDLFLFYGLYRNVNISHGKISYERKEPRKHVIWGWLTVGDMLPIHSENDDPAWARYHPHFTDKRGKNNTVCLAADEVFGGLRGAGVFEEYHRDLCLTDLDETPVRPSRWSLPRWFAPRNDHYALSYHSRPDLWREDVGRDRILLRTKSPGQEFVLNAEIYPEAIEWARDLIRKRANPKG